MSTTTREQCIKLLNRFIKTHLLEDAKTILEIASEDLNSDTKKKSIDTALSNSLLANSIVNKAIEKICTQYNIITISTTTTNFYYFY